jgi:cation:H+ antiporter
MSYLIVLIGFAMLIKGADIFVEGASSIAKRFHIPEMIIGLTIVAMGTSLPELSVSFISALNGQSDMSIANAIGSNIFNILMILGVSAFIKTLYIKESSIKDIMILIGATALLLILSYFGLSLIWFDGLIMLCLFAYFIRKMIKESKENSEKCECDSEPLSMIKTIIYVVLGAVGIIYGGTFVVNGATSIAKIFGMSDNLIGLTVVALGTSLPEFVTSVIATKKGKLDIAIGNVIGSNIFNILFVLGVSSLFNVLTVSVITLIDIFFSLFISMALLSVVCKYKKLGKLNSITFIVLYVSYMIFTIIR